MSEPSIARFPSHPIKPRDNNHDAAEQARQRIAVLPDTYLAHAAPAKEELIGAIHPVSPAAQSASGDMKIVNSQTTAAPAIEPKQAPAETKPKPKKREQQPSDSPVSRGKLPSQLKPLIAAAITFVLLYLVFKAPIFLSQIGYLTKSQPSVSNPATTASAQVPPDPVISIPKINVHAPVVYANSNVEASIQKDLESGVVHYANTALPGENGNSVIFGHSSNDWWEPGNYKFVFVLLDKLQPGDTFTVNYNSKQYVYKVVESKVVEPTDLSVLNQTSDPEMTLITCTPPGTSWKRLVVRAAQISPSTATTPASSSSTTQAGGTLPSNSPSLTNQISAGWKNFLHFLGIGGSSNSPQSTPSDSNTLPASK